jgi:5-methylcytosine-specific restriction protein A
MPREFRTEESYQAEKVTRASLVPFLEERGFSSVDDRRKKYGKNESQTIHAVDPSGHAVSMRVKLCWRLGREGKGRGYSAAQLLAKVDRQNPDRDMEDFQAKLVADRVSHLLVVQSDGTSVIAAASIPVNSVAEIWRAQRDESARLLEMGVAGRRKSNQALNGDSPTIWLSDEKVPSIAQKLWQHPGVVDLVKLPVLSTQNPSDDTFNDLAGLDLALLGRDQGKRFQQIVSGVKRDPAVRRAVIKRCNGTCERPGCGAGRAYPGFLDVHHILGAEKSDRLWTCVALCPNCHREAHFSPESDQLNAELLEFARRFSPSKTR